MYLFPTSSGQVLEEKKFYEFELVITPPETENELSNRIYQK